MDEVIVPQQVRSVDFYGDRVLVAVEKDTLFVPLQALAENLGLDVNSQAKRVRRDAVMKAKARLVEIHGADGRTRPLLCLPLDIVPGWLFGIDTGRVKPELKEKLNLYRAECFNVLWNAFKSDIMPPSQQAQTLTPAEQILQQTEALYKLAQQQVELERQYKTMAEYTKGFIRETRGHLSTHDTNLADHEQRLVSIELRLDPAANITDAEAAEIALGVKNVAYAMGGGSRSYGKVYSEIYRRYRISSYKNLPRAKYDEVIAWLSRWFDEVAGDDSDDVGMEN